MVLKAIVRNKAQDRSELHVEVVPDHIWMGIAAHPVTKAEYPLLMFTWSSAAGELILDIFKRISRRRKTPEVYVIRRGVVQWEVAIFFHLPRASKKLVRKLANYDLETILALPAKGAVVTVVAFADCSAAAAEPFLRSYKKTKWFCLSLEVIGKPELTDLQLNSFKSELPPPYNDQQ